MSHVHHELGEEFPEHKEKIHDLKIRNAHFARLSDTYHKVNREIHRIEAAGINVDEVHFENLKKERLKLLDEISGMLRG